MSQIPFFSLQAQLFGKRKGSCRNKRPLLAQWMLFKTSNNLQCLEGKLGDIGNIILFFFFTQIKIQGSCKVKKLLFTMSVDSIFRSWNPRFQNDECIPVTKKKITVKSKNQGNTIISSSTQETNMAWVSMHFLVCWFSKT